MTREFLCGILVSNKRESVWNNDRMQLTIKVKKFDKDILFVGIHICRQGQFDCLLHSKKLQPTLNLHVTKNRISAKSRAEIKSLKRVIRNMRIRVSDKLGEV